MPQRESNNLDMLINDILRFTSKITKMHIFKVKYM